MKHLTDMLCTAFITLACGFLTAMSIWGILAAIAYSISIIA